MADLKGVSSLGGAGFGAARQSEPSVTARLGEASLADIAKRVNISLDALLGANPQIKDPNALTAGQEIRLPRNQEAHGETASAEMAQEAGAAASPASPAGDPLLRSLFEARFNREAPAASPPGGRVMYVNDGGTAATATPARTGPSVAPDVAGLLAEGAQVPKAAPDFKAAQKAIATGDYAQAYAHLESLMRKDGEDVLSEDAVEGTETVRDQLGFLAGMQKAGIKADYPPTEAQLVQYFQTLKDDPAAARQAFKDYTQPFHVHPSNIPGKGSDVKYSDDHNATHTSVPDDWSEVANRPSGDKAKYIGKQINDCEGFAFMAEKLLGAAGFKLADHVTAYPGPNDSGHSMAAFTHPKEKGFTVASNDAVFRAQTEKAAAAEGLKYAAGSTTGTEKYYVGKTMADSESQVAVDGRRL